MNLRQPQLIITHMLLALLFLSFSSVVFAYSNFSGCENCHGGFRDNNYVSKTDGTAWNTDLMTGHETFVSSCNACHNSSGFGEVYLNSSADATLSKGCVGCHGREQDVNNSCVNAGGVQVECGAGAGLRMVHETNVGAGTCSSCHAGDPAPTGEQNNPFYYGLSGVQTLDACNADGTESRYGLYGLDNDGDGQVDANDSDCGFVINPGLSGNWWGGLSRNGEGFLLDVAYDINSNTIIVVSFYTYDSMGNQVFLVGASVANSDTATISLEITEGAKWGAAFNPDDVVRTAWGTVTFTFASCEAGHVSFAPNQDMQALGFTNLEYDINRDILIPGIQCPIANPQ